MDVQEINELVKNIVTNLANNQLIVFSALILPITAEITHGIGKRFKLQRKNKIENCKVIYESPALKTNRKKKSNENLSEIKDLIAEALTTLSQEVSAESMQIIKKNLTSISSDSNFIKSLYLTHRKAGGVYFDSIHHITINQKYYKKDVLSHELMHAASSFDYNDKRGTGFHQKIGVGINEGYTDLISQRYFCKDINTAEIEGGYPYNKVVSEIVETIIGKRKMLDLYFHGNLKGLVEELSKYQSEDKVKQFILDLDTINNTYIQNKFEHMTTSDIQTTSFNRISIFLYDTFSAKNDKNKDFKSYLQESKNFLELFQKLNVERQKIIQRNNQSKISRIINKVINTNKSNTQDSTEESSNKTDATKISKPKTLTRKKGGFINILTITLLLGVIITISITISYLILKVS